MDHWISPLSVIQCTLSSKQNPTLHQHSIKFTPITEEKRCELIRYNYNNQQCQCGEKENIKLLPLNQSRMLF